MAVTEDSHTRQLSLIKFARTLEQDTSRTVNQKIDQLWPVLSSVKDAKFMAAEESILRWLLKQMDAATETAEQVRRYPLTWTILGCLIERLSLFSLSKIFLERRFLAVLQSSAKDISQAQQQSQAMVANGDVSSKKRKRDEVATFDIVYLRTPEGCIKSATELFSALKKLMTRLEETETRRSEDVRIGAEHVKSLLQLPTKQAQDLILPLLRICGQALISFDKGLTDEHRDWVEITTSIWDQHLGSKGDSYEFATHLYFPSCLILSKLKDIDAGVAIEGDSAIRWLWMRRLDQFLMKNVLNIARTGFADHGDLELLKTVVNATSNQSRISSRILWDLATKTRRNLDDPISKKEHESWAQAVFAYLMSALERSHTADANILSDMLEVAVESESFPDSKTLHEICTKYALLDDHTDYGLLVKVMQCDPDVFILDDHLLSTVMGRLTSILVEDERLDQAVTGIINPLLEAFVKARDLPGFVKRWYQQLAEFEKTSVEPTVDQSIWHDSRLTLRFAQLMQAALSIQQLAVLLDWLEAQTSRTEGPFLIILNGICLALAEEDYISVVGWRICKASFRNSSLHNLPPRLSAIRWKIAGRAASWLAKGDLHRLCEMISCSLADVLEKGALSDPVTFYAFECDCGLYLANHPDGPDEAELSEMTCLFIQRVITAVDVIDEIQEIYGHVVFILRSLPRLAESYSPAGQRLLELLSSLSHQLFERSQRRGEDHQVVEELFDSSLTCSVGHVDEVLAGTLIEPLLRALEGDGEKSGWVGVQSQFTISTMMKLPMAVFLRDRRKRIMLSWKKHSSEILKRTSSDTDDEKRVLSLLVKVMRQPTFYTDMDFHDILGFCRGSSQSRPTLALIEELVQLTTTQMIRSTDELSATYLEDVCRYVGNIDPARFNSSLVDLAILRGIAIALRFNDSDSKLHGEMVAKRLIQMVESNLSQFASKWKGAQSLGKDDKEMALLAMTLDAFEAVNDGISAPMIKMSLQEQKILDSACEELAAQRVEIGIRLKTLLVSTRHGPLNVAASVNELSRLYSTTIGQKYSSGFVDAVVQDVDSASRLKVLADLLHSLEGSEPSDVPYIFMSRLVDTIQVDSGPISIAGEEGNTFDVEALQTTLASHLTKARSLEQFTLVSKTLNILLNKHARAIKQASIDSTLASIAIVCSEQGPQIKDEHPEGQIFEDIYKLLSTVIKRHRLRLEGRLDLLVTVLQALLRVVLANPRSLQSHRSASLSRPPWLLRRLQTHHVAKFTRLLTLVCEPSAASVAHAKRNALDSATDAAKRSAGQHMFRVLQLYIKLQLDGDVPREMRKALEPGLHSILNVTTEGGRRILNESMDASGRAIFRTVFAEYKRNGRWTGV